MNERIDRGGWDDEDEAPPVPLSAAQAQALRNAALQGQPFCAECEAARAAYQALMA